MSFSALFYIFSLSFCFSDIGFTNALFYKFTETCGTQSYLPSDTFETVNANSLLACMANCVGITQNGSGIVCFGINFCTGQDCELLLIGSTADLVSVNCGLAQSKTNCEHRQIDIRCPNPPNRPGATIQGDPNNIIGGSRHYLCAGMSAPLPGATIQCLMDARWTEDTFACPCGPLPVVANATFLPGSDGVGSRRGYVCHGQLTPVDDAYVECLPDFTWTVPVTRCVWPKLSFALRKPLAGCPTGFSEFSINYPISKVGGGTGNEFSAGNHISGEQATTTMRFDSCIKNNAYIPYREYDWPTGDYCILTDVRHCCCPFSFGSKGSILLYNGGSVHGYKYCCRSDGDVNTEIHLPRHQPFYLQPYSDSQCQAVRGMDSSLEYAHFDDVSVSIFINPPRPFMDIMGTSIATNNYEDYQLRLYLCYYVPK